MVNETIPALIEPITIGVSSVMNVLKAGLGGIFGLYLLLVIVKWWEARQLKKIMIEVREGIKELNVTVAKIEKIGEKKVNQTPKKP